MKFWRVAAVWMGIYLATAAGQTRFMEHAFLAWAWLHGRFSIEPNAVHEQVVLAGHRYILHPPLAAAAMVPFVMIHGLAVNPTAVCAMAGGLGVAALWKLTRSHWIAAFFALGTPLWYEATLGNPWGMCLVLSVIPTALALDELQRQGRPSRVGIWAGIAALARYDLAAVWPVYALWLWRSPRGYLLRRRVGPFCFGIAGAALLYLALNEMRFGAMTDPTLWIWYRIDPAGAAANPGVGPFSLRYLPMGLYTALFMGPAFQAAFPYLRPHAMGEALLLTSPAFILTLRARFTGHTPFLWMAVALGMSGALCVWSNGVEQLGARYWIQAYPFLAALIAREEVDGFAKILIAASIVSMAAQMWIVRTYGLAGV